MCADPSTLDGLAWLLCYLTTGKHLAFYASFGTVFILLALTAPAALLMGFAGAVAAPGVEVDQIDRLRHVAVDECL